MLNITLHQVLNSGPFLPKLLLSPVFESTFPISMPVKILHKSQMLLLFSIGHKDSIEKLYPFKFGLVPSCLRDVLVCRNV